jgi:hypothetical protein
MTGPSEIRFALAWFKPDEWPELKALCPDLQDTYAEWLDNALAGLNGLGLGEHDIDKVILSADDLRDWQAANGGQVNSKVRAGLASEASAKRKATHH